MDWASLTDKAGAFLTHWTDLSYIFFVVVAVLVLNWGTQWVLYLITRHEDPAKRVWRHAFLRALGPPLRAIFWLIGLTIIADQFMPSGDTDQSLTFVSIFPQARNVLAVIAVAWFLMRLVTRVQDNLDARASNRGEPLDPTASDAIGKIARAAVIITALLAIMQNLGFSLTSLLAFGGAAGIALGFAAQSLVANLLGGLTVFATRIFKIGEDIIIPGTELNGEVEHIGWRATRVMGWDRKPFYVPNSMFNTTTVINHSRKEYRRIMEYVHLRYRDIEKVKAIVADGNEMISQHPDIDHSFFVFRFDSYGDFALKLFLYAYSPVTNYPKFTAVKEDVLLKLARIVREQGAELAIPVSTVHMPDGLRIADDRPAAASEPGAANRGPENGDSG